MQELERNKRFVNEILFNIRGRLQMLHKDFQQFSQMRDESKEMQGRLHAIAQEIGAANQAIMGHSAQIQRISQQQLQTSHDWLQTSRNFPVDQEALFLRSYAGQLRSSSGAVASHLGSTAVQMRLLQQQQQALMGQDRPRPTVAAELETLRRQHQYMTGQHQALLRQQQAISAEMERVQQRFRALRARSQQTGPRKYNNLMTHSEKQWLVKIQLKQLQTENPYLDDFYFQTYTQRRVREMQMLAAAEGRPVMPVVVPNTLPGAEPHPLHSSSSDYRPDVHFDQKTLGHITGFNLRTPRQLIGAAVRTSPPPADATESEQSAAKQEIKLRRQTLILVEELYKVALRTESLDKTASAAQSAQARHGIFEERKAGLDAVFPLLHADDSSPTGFLARLSAVRKGVTVLSRILIYFSFQQAVQIINSMMIILSKRSGEAADALSGFVMAVQRAFEYLPMRALIDQLEGFHKLAATPEGRAFFMGKYGGGLMFTLQRRADHLLVQAPQDDRTHWVAASQGTAKELCSAFEEQLKKKGDSHSLLWQVASMFVAHCGDPTKKLLREALAATAKAQHAAEPTNPAVAQFIHLTN
eukprot:m.139165 g.139165  ORF g.139165 m.139165 type:complete len:585 (+) comp16650_c2_seq1:769-2523(+)